MLALIIYASVDYLLGGLIIIGELHPLLTVLIIDDTLSVDCLRQR